MNTKELYLDREGLMLGDASEILSSGIYLDLTLLPTEGTDWTLVQKIS